ncbi:unnamed protein product [Medioppia subpectinata]|uniref:Guanine nucleotide-binding protein-like 1 n=1 Tax=Medioppia subpectinata TaxID=1979941 RepID=A0A7R9KTQ5_9ACAR|nr:unnamed protein product [Medioppia subpectinata]CAG2108262.1 unnamed protein product [Medioppia subpectinata]
MPQRGGRKVAFSAKQKKQQLKDKRDHKKTTTRGLQETQHVTTDDTSEAFSGDDSAEESVIVGHNLGGDSTASTSVGQSGVRQMNVQNRVDKSRDVNRFALQFFRESDEELRQKREESGQPFQVLPESGREVSVEEVFSGGGVGDQSAHDMPRRPKWDRNTSAAQLEAAEHKYFRHYLDTITATNERLSYFELNLETWRQLWRVLEMSDIVLLIADIRHPVFHFPPSLYRYVVHELRKDMILVLNKVDLVDASLVIAWTHYLKHTFPELHVLSFASYAGMRLKNNKKRIGKLRMASNAARALQALCQRICGQRVDLSNWRKKIDDELRAEESTASRPDDTDDDNDDSDEDTQRRDPLKTGQQKRAKVDLNYYEQTERFKDGVVTIGCVGHPNVGKSSLLNAIMGRKVVSVSRTPGHTKHFQTIFLTPTVRLCDCPGLVFPSRAPKELQVLMGCYPIAQLRQPFAAVGYISQRIPVQRLLRLQHPNSDECVSSASSGGQQWSAYDVCESWAIKRGFYTAKAARPDAHRAANHLLRMALDGRTLCLAFFPPDYCRQKSTVWATHPDVEYMETIRGHRLADDSDGEEMADNDVKDSEEESEGDDEEEEAIQTKSRFAVLAESD